MYEFALNVQENNIPVVVFNISTEGNIMNALWGKSVGTCVGSGIVEATESSLASEGEDAEATSPKA